MYEFITRGWHVCALGSIGARRLIGVLTRGIVAKATM